MYLFINPIGDVCYHAEQNILRLMKDSNQEIRFRFIPLLNMQSIADIMKLSGIPQNDLAKRNKLVTSIYHAALDFKAALFQGKKRGRAFLLNVQKQMLSVNDLCNYSDQIALPAAKECGLDLEMFLEDRNSEFTARSFIKDQKTAAEMNVSHHPTVVLFNVKGYECGISMDACKSYSVLKKIFAGQAPNELIEQSCGYQTQLNSFLKTNHTPLKVRIDSGN